LASFGFATGDIGPKLGSFGFVLGSNWVRFWVKQAIFDEKWGKLGSFVKIRCVWKYVIIERVPKMPKMPNMNYSCCGG
jgi:hypothetical protein